jgi:hypothetical protein
MDNTFNDMLNPNAVHNRTLRCYVLDVESTEGFIRLKHDGMPGQGRSASIPWLWASFPDPTTEGGKRKGAWGRYIPFKNDLLKIGYDWDDKIHVLGYDTKYYSSNTSANQCGWGQITTESAGDNPLVLSQFRTLKSGEYDFMSIGGAYVFGSDKGLLHFEGGPSQLNLTKSNNSIDSIAQAYQITSQASQIRYGQVRRFSPVPSPFGVGEIAAAPWNPTGAFVEHQILLQQLVMPSPVPLAVVRHAMGNVTTNPPIGGGIPEISTTTGQLKRFTFEVFDAASGLIPMYQDEVDMLGSQTVQASTATQFNVLYPLGTVKFMSLSSLYNTSTDTKMVVGTSFDATIGTSFTVTTLGGGVAMMSGLESTFTSVLGTTINAGAALALSGATASITAGGMAIGMSGGAITLGGATSASMMYTQFNSGVAASTLTFVDEMAAGIAPLGAGFATGLQVAAAILPITTWINAIAARLAASGNERVRI